MPKQFHVILNNTFSTKHESPGIDLKKLDSLVKSSSSFILFNTAKVRKHLKTYENILDSVRAYHLTLNRLDPYDQFRQLRTNTDDPLILVEGLSLYSARGEEYVEEIKNIILSNELQKYDSYHLSDPDQAKFVNPSTKSTSIAESDKVSL